ncbi:MAG: alpha/beta hydrolase [Caldilineaceae bacterium]|nr:alpha/beta hydrolase [Caldilineaceae bacterium]
MRQTIPYNADQTLAYADYGPPDGYPLLVQHGLIASIREGQLFDSLTTAGVRVICAARPGYGDSSPYVMTQVAEWGEIVARLMDRLHLAQVDLLGISSGAPYAYAIAHQRPAQVRNIFIFSGIPALYDDTVLALWPHPVDKTATLTELAALAKALFFADLPPTALTQPDLQDSLRNDGFGLGLDWQIRCHDWGFRLEEITQPVYLEHSRTDNLPPVERTAALLPHSRLTIRETGEHFSPELLDEFIKTTVLPKMRK